MYYVHFAGIIYFNVCTADGKIALVPNGTAGIDRIPPHIASFFIEVDRHDSDSWWADQKHLVEVEIQAGGGSGKRKVKLFEFRIPKRAVITFDCGDAKLDPINFGALPQLTKIAPGFVLDLKDTDAIAELPLPGGELEVFRFGNDELAVVRWTITKHSDPITITADAGDGLKRVTLKRIGKGAPPEIVFSNTPDLIKSANERLARERAGLNPSAGRNAEHEHGKIHHLRLYARLDKERDARKFKDQDLPTYEKLNKLPSPHHPYLQYLLEVEEIPLPGCVPTCCAG
jgi:hypothetical protein